MKRTYGTVGLLALALITGAWGCGKQDPASPRYGTAANLDFIRSGVREFRAGGDITPVVDAYRAALGTLNANVPGSLGSGRREINWDGVPAAVTNTNTFPADFFNQPVAGRARGVVFSTPGSGFRTSDNDFADVSAALGEQFSFFSPLKTFAAVGSREMTVGFFVPGSQEAALSSGFGVVFSDVDREGSASIRLFDAEGRNLGRYAAPAADGGLSFVGVLFPAAVIARVEIISGQAAVAANAIDVDDLDASPARDLVIMDDFIYGEPLAVSADVTPEIRAQ